MERCPKCGHREGVDWPAVLCAVAFSILYFVFTFAEYEYHAPKGYRLVGFAAMLLFIAGNGWRQSRNKRDRREYLKLHPPITERVKDHLKASPSQ